MVITVANALAGPRHRRSESAIRIALGAGPRTMMTLVLSNVSVVTLTGLTVGIALAAGTGRFVNTLLFGLVADDITMVVVAAVTLGAATRWWRYASSNAARARRGAT